MSSRFFPTFSSIRFSVSGFMLRSLIHLDLSFVYHDKYGSIFIFLYTDSQLFWASLTKIKYACVCVCVWFYFWVFNSILLINLSVSVPISFSFYHYCSVVALEVRDADSPRHYFIVKNCFHYSGSFAFPDEFENSSFHVFEELCWEFDGDYIEYDYLW